MNREILEESREPSILASFWRDDHGFELDARPNGLFEEMSPFEQGTVVFTPTHSANILQVPISYARDHGYRSYLFENRVAIMDRTSWLPLQSGLRVAVASSSTDKLLGVREGFQRFLRDGMHSSANVTVSSASKDSRFESVPSSDEEALRMAREKLDRLAEITGPDFDCLAASEGGMFSISLNGELRNFVRTWTIVRGFGGEAWGASGSIQIPSSIFSISQGQAPRSVPGGRRRGSTPGTRRSGGMMGSITRGIETRRRAVVESSCNALATLVYEGLGNELV